ncbi:hypothetical protein [Caloranaerobacter ferrireducens]|uniref:hypothetical protein n=1 Tax=Caloranaerobacter ferrireducens TaxID=1323370 RepID=UPI00084D6DB5|nr:hypothetical protein [Caloranaerobacter ferrireducens]
MNEKDCFAYKNKKCSILKSKKCEGTQCGFYKTHKQYQLGQKKALERILSLGEEKMKYIDETYYGGKMGVMQP